ncbi:MAG: hypothetical protein K2Z80_28680 [Xanthobacteraceae bacterium]|nr:hypothetical protein [Xanthobacteraceae bacterium]
MTSRLLAIAVAVVFAAGSAGAAEFTYSATSGPGCTNIRSKREFNSWRCQGPAGYSAVYHDLGNMVAVELGPTGREKAIIEDGLLWQGADSKAFGDRLEWRLVGGRPYAAILRIRRGDFDMKADKAITVEELLVIKVTPQGACSMGVVDGKSLDANTVARDIADSSATAFRCGTDKPRAMGMSASSPNR